MEGNLRFKIDWASLEVERKFTDFALFYFAFECKSTREFFGIPSRSICQMLANFSAVQL